MSRVDAPADVQWTRAFVAVIAGVVLAFAALHPAMPMPGAGTLPAELRALAALPCLVMQIARGE